MKKSIEKEDFSKYDCCVVNDSVLTDFFWKLRPSYYFMIDDQYFYTKEDVFAENNKNLVEAFKKVSWPIKVFVPIKWKSDARYLFGDNKNIKLVGFYSNPLTDSFEFKKIKMFLFKKGIANPRYMNVCCAALFCLLNAGYKKIFLFGLDLSWTSLLYVGKDNIVYMKNQHYYDDKYDSTKYVQDGKPIRFHEVLRYTAIGGASFWDIRDYSDYLGDVEIINKSENSFVDAFKKQ